MEHERTCATSGIGIPMQKDTVTEQKQKAKSKKQNAKQKIKLLGKLWA